MIKIKLMGHELEADLLNPDVAKTYEDEFYKCVKRIYAAGDCEKGSDGIREQCNAVIEYIDAVFGTGTSSLILGENANLLTCLDVLEELGSLYDGQVLPLVKKKTRSLEKALKK